MSTSLLLDAIRLTGVEFWNDSAGADELAFAIANGATGATTNPPLVLAAVRSEGATWRDRARELAVEHATWGETDVTWRIVEEVSARGAGVLEPVFERTGGQQGRLSAQVNPILARDTEAMLVQAERLSGLRPNVQVKLPVTSAGLSALEQATFRGIEVNATVNFTVAGALAVAEAIERGLDRRAAAGLGGTLHPVCTLMLGRLDDWIKAAAARDDVLLTPGRAEWSGVAVFKRAHGLYRERGYRTRLLGGAFRDHLPWTQLLGPGTLLTFGPSWQRWLNESGLPIESRLEEPVNGAIVDELLERSPEFRLAYEPDGLTTEALETYGAYRRTMRQFLGALADLQAEVRGALIPDPDRRPAGG